LLPLNEEGDLAIKSAYLPNFDYYFTVSGKIFIFLFEDSFEESYVGFLSFFSNFFSITWIYN